MLIIKPDLDPQPERESSVLPEMNTATAGSSPQTGAISTNNLNAETPSISPVITSNPTPESVVARVGSPPQILTTTSAINNIKSEAPSLPSGSAAKAPTDSQASARKVDDLSSKEMKLLVLHNFDISDLSMGQLQMLAEKTPVRDPTTPDSAGSC